MLDWRLTIYKHPQPTHVKKELLKVVGQIGHLVAARTWQHTLVAIVISAMVLYLLKWHKMYYLLYMQLYYLPSRSQLSSI